MQCEQTKNGTGCTTIGVCGKTPEVASLQDLFVHQLKGVSCWAHEGRKHGAFSALRTISLTRHCLFPI